MKDLAKLMRNRPPPSKEAFDKAFGGTRAVEAAAASDDDVTFDDVYVERDLDKARLVRGLPNPPFPGAGHWVPKSLTVSAPELHTRGRIVVAAWLARKEGWI